MKNRKMVKKKSKNNTTPIIKHRQVGKKLIPPFLEIPKFKPRSWINEALPEMLWAILLITNLPREETLSLFREVINQMASFAKDKKPKEIKFNPTITGFSHLTDEQFDTIMRVLCKKKKYRKLLVPLLFYKKLPKYEGWKKCIEITPEKNDWKTIKSSVTKTIWHQTQEATDCRWITVCFYIITGKFRMYEETEREILNYPNCGDMRKVRPTIRASEIAVFGLSEIDKKWATDFWRTSLRLTSCKAVRKPNKKDKGVSEKLKKKINGGFAKLFNKFFDTLDTTSINSKHDTVFGLAFFAWRLTAEIVFGRTNEMVLGRLGLRSLAECYIVLSYLIDKDSKDRWDTYRCHGSGQAKLAYMKFEKMHDMPKYFDLDEIRSIANEDMWVEFMPINLGHWDLSDLRKISIATNTKDIYDKYYSWPSNYSHSQWGAVRETVYQTCLNPLHRLHRIPLSQDKVFNDATNDAILLFDKTMKLVDKAYPDKKKKRK